MKRLLIKRGEETRDALQSWGIHHKHVPFVISPKLKEPYKNSWHDEHGDEEYYPAEPKFESYEMKLDLVCICEEGESNERIRKFINFISKDFFSIYDEYSKVGRQKVRLVSADSDANLYRREKDIVEFSVTLKVNDPTTEIELTL